jgi:hypothetical protein
VEFGLCVSYKPKYSGFKKLSRHLYQREISNIPEDIKELGPSLELVLKMKRYDGGLPEPYLLARHKKYEKVRPKLSIEKYENDVLRTFKKASELLKPELIFAVDTGGDSLTGGVEDELSFDKTGLKALKQLGVPFVYIVLGPGCDGESTIPMLKSAVKRESKAGSLLGEFDLKNIIEIWEPISTNLLDFKRTPNIIANAKSKIERNPDLANDLTTIQRHRIPDVPTSWLIKGIAFDGLKLSN